MYKTLREEAYEANMEIFRQNLAVYTWGNSSAFDPDKGVFAIKPSGVEYKKLSPKLMVLVDLNGKIVEGKLKPSSDTKTHLVLYREFSGIRGVTHTHSPYAVSWAQAKKYVPVFGTTHADNCSQEIPCTDFISAQALENDYELETGKLIVETFKIGNLDPAFVTMALVGGHGPFTWGESASLSVYHSVVLEEICKMALFTVTLDPQTKPLPDYIAKKHWERKHGKNSYYGQEKLII
ncbi:MAG: L-ribulose-5-phosphate 4-epimerase AraD [Bacteroidales bacterium]|jgi:L-ribulose-5-phosphate 4-epimerase|nr:L-ribulose-5-phosphate 4-epimerase AraD [Bacteroidales bacterium]